MNWIHQAACRGHDPELWFSTRPSKTKTALAVSLNAAIRKCMRRVARMCADCSAREQLDHQEGARA